MSDERPTFGSLFAGIGGIDLGLERAGWRCQFQVEWDPFCQRVLAKHWPDVPRWGDITDVDFRGLGPLDLLAGGFPCQPVSVAGKREAQEDLRWLWPEFARAIRELRPRYVLVENVRNLLAIDEGGPFGEVSGDLAALGYDSQWDCIPASAYGAPHQRDRLWLVAYAERDGQGGTRVGNRTERPSDEPLADTDDRDAQGFVQGGDDPEDRREPGERPAGLRGGTGRHRVGTAQPRLVRAPDGLPEWMDGHRWPAPPGPQYDWEPPRTVIGRLPNRAARIKAIGNAVVPQVVEGIGRRILEAEALT